MLQIVHLISVLQRYIYKCPLRIKSLLEWHHDVANVRGYQSTNVKDLCSAYLMGILKRGSVNEGNLARAADLIHGSSDREASG